MSEPLDPPQPPAGSPPPPPEGGSAFTPPPAGGDGGDGGGGSTTPPGNPWEQRDRLGFVPAFIENVKLFALSPSEAFARTRRTGDYVGPLIFGVLVGWIGYLFYTIWNLLLGGIVQSWMMGMMPPEMQGQVGPSSMMVSGAMSFVWLILYPVIAAVFMFIGAGILHLCGMLTGALNNSDSGFEGTFRAVAFTSVSNLASIVPLVGGFIGLIWFIFLATVGLSTMHRTTQGKALLTVLLPIILCCVCCLAFFFLGIGAGVMSGIANQ